MVGLDDRRLATARRADEIAIRKGRAGAEHRERQHGRDRDHTAALARLLLGLLVIGALIGIGIVGIGGIALIIRGGLDLPVQRIVIARGIGLSLIGVWLFVLILILRLLRRHWRSRLRITVQWMHRGRLIVCLVVVLRLGLLGPRIGALHPWRRPGRRLGLRLVLLRIVFLGLVLRRLVTLRGLRLGFHIGAAHRKGIGLADQARQFGQGIAFDILAMLICAAAIVIMGGKLSVLISISHRLRCIPSQEGAKS